MMRITFSTKTVSIQVICIFIYLYIVLVMTQLIQKTFLFLVHSLRALGSMEMRLHYGRGYTKNIKRPESYWLTLDQTKHLVMIRLAEATTQYSLTLRKQIRQIHYYLFRITLKVCEWNLWFGKLH